MSLSPVEIRVPGKIIIVGEHAAVFGRPMLLAAVNLYCTVKITPRADRVMHIASPAIDFEHEYHIEEIIDLTHRARKAWASMVSGESEVEYVSLNQRDETLLILAVGEAILNLGGTFTQGASIEILSEIPPGIGLGSSAVISVGVVEAIAEYLQHDLEVSKVFDIAYDIEKKKHGLPSGGDVATVAYGGLVWYRKETEFLRIIKPIDNLHENIHVLSHFVLISTGRPANTTGDAIAQTKRLYEAKPREVTEIFDGIESATKATLTALFYDDIKGLVKAIRSNHEFLCKLHVVPEFTLQIIEEIMSQGGAGKITGGGGIHGDSAGIIVAVHEDIEILTKIAEKSNLAYYVVSLAGR